MHTKAKCITKRRILRGHESAEYPVALTLRKPIGFKDCPILINTAIKEVMRNWSSYGSAMTPKDQYFRARIRCIIGIGLITILLIVAAITLPLVLTEPTTEPEETTTTPEEEGKCIAYYLLHFST